MADPQLFGITRDDILTIQLPALGVRGSALAAYDALDTDGDLLLEAAADIGDALQKGGHGLEPTVNSTDTPYAYRKLRALLRERVALLYLEIVGQGMSREKLDRRQKNHNSKMLEIEKGEPIGELVVTDGQNRVQFQHGTDARTDIDSRRYKATAEM